MTATCNIPTAKPEDLLDFGCDELGLRLDPEIRQQLLFYAHELLKWNARVNLTGLKTMQEVVVKHFLDSLAVWPWVKDLETLADIGSGGGFPGLPLKLVRPQLQVTLIEPNGKKTAFLHFVIAHLGLQHAEVRQIHLTGQEACRWEPAFQGVITRAAFSLAHYLKIGAPLLKPGGRLLAMKGPRLAVQEWQEAVDRTPAYFPSPPEKINYFLPLTGERRLLVIWEKPA